MEWQKWQLAFLVVFGMGLGCAFFVVWLLDRKARPVILAHGFGSWDPKAGTLVDTRAHFTQDLVGCDLFLEWEREHGWHKECHRIVGAASRTLEVGYVNSGPNVDAATYVVMRGRK